MKILALDPATRTGFCWSDGTKRVSGVWILSGDIGQKLMVLRGNILDAAKAWGIEQIVYELASFGARGTAGKGGPHWSTIVFHNQVRGVIDQVNAELGLPAPLGYHPASLKLFATFSGAAKKDQVMRACETRLGIKPADDNEADAIWLEQMAREGYEPPGKRAKRILKAAKVARKKDPTLFPMGKERIRQVRRST